MYSNSAHPSDLADRLCAYASRGRADAYYRLARIVAQVLVSERLRRREKWCALARELMADPGTEERLVLQAIRWLRSDCLPTPSAS